MAAADDYMVEAPAPLSRKIQLTKQEEKDPVLATKRNKPDDSSTWPVGKRARTEEFGNTETSVDDTAEVPFPLVNGFVVERQVPDPSRYVALDCEFVGVGNDISALGRCSIVDFNGKVLCDVYAWPNQPITRYRTKWSGLTRGIMKRHAIPSDVALTKIKDIIQDKIVVGHALRNDFTVLDIQHPIQNRRDTSTCDLLKQNISKGPSLKNMSLELLGKVIQIGRHCSVADAQTAMELYRLVRDDWENSIINTPLDIIQSECETKSSKKKKKKRPKNKQKSRTLPFQIHSSLPVHVSDFTVFCPDSYPPYQKC